MKDQNLQISSLSIPPGLISSGKVSPWVFSKAIPNIFSDIFYFQDCHSAKPRTFC